MLDGVAYIGQALNVEATTRTAGAGITETAAQEVATTVTRTMEEATTATSTVPIVRMDTAR